MDAVTLAIVIAVAVVVAVVAGGVALVGRRGTDRPLPPAETPDLRAGAPSAGTGVLDRPAPPAADVDDLTAPATEVAEPEPAIAEPDLLVEPELPAIERPEPAAGRLVRLRGRLSRSNTSLGKGLLALLSRDTLDEATWDEIEETLLLADVGVEPATELVEGLRRRVAVLGHAGRRARPGRCCARSCSRSSTPHRWTARSPSSATRTGRPSSSSSASTAPARPPPSASWPGCWWRRTRTSCSARPTRSARPRPTSSQTWGERVGVPTVRSDRDGADPAAVAFDAVKAGIEMEADVVLVDTAGRLQNKVGLMDELGKVKRVIEKHGPVDEVLLVLDATTGQNGMQQAQVFAEVVDVTGIVLTKLDGTAKGGIVIAVQRELGVPVKLVGLGEGPDDLAPFDPAAFVDALVS